MSNCKSQFRCIAMVALSLSLASLVVSADTGLDAQALLSAGDAIRNPEGSYSVVIELKEYRDKKLSATSVLSVFSRPDPNSGQYNSLLHFKEPVQDANKLMLKNGKDLWFYDPSSKLSIRISPRARLIGQASNGDVMSVNLAKEYDAQLVAVEEVTDASNVIRKTAHLSLVARPNADVIYPTADYWVDIKTSEPVKAQFKTAENRLLKTAYFRRFEIILGKSRPTETIIIDGLNPNWVTVMRSYKLKKQDIPENWLSRGFLPHFLSEVK